MHSHLSVLLPAMLFPVSCQSTTHLCTGKKQQVRTGKYKSKGKKGEKEKCDTWKQTTGKFLLRVKQVKILQVEFNSVKTVLREQVTHIEIENKS